MDIWKWVYEVEKNLRKDGHTRLAELVDRLPTEVCNDRHDRVDAIFPEAIALAKSIEHPWLEVFLRHWWLQSRILHRMEGTALGEAVSLVDFAHQEATQGCPQGVCAVQDLCACYGFVDSSGFADERLEVARETLARIDESWPCFTCISSEYASALRAKGDVQGSLAFVDAQIAALNAKGQRKAIYDLPRERVEAFIDLGRLDDALAFTDDCERNGRRDAHHRLMRRIDRARIHVRAGRTKEALEAFPSADEVDPTPLFYWFWLDAAAHLARAGAIDNDGALGRIFQRFIDRLERQGVGRTTLELAQIHAELALERGAPHVARRALATMERASKVLNKPLDALDRIGKVRRAIEASPGLGGVALPETVEALFDTLRARGGKDREGDLLLIEAAHARWPDDVDVVAALANVLSAMGLESEAIEELTTFHARIAADDVAIRLGELLIARKDEKALESLCESHRRRAVDEASRGIADWILARSAQEAGDFQACIGHLDAVLASRPNAINARILHAEASRRLGDHARSLEKLDEVVERVAEAGPWDWDRMIAATILGDWAKVRDSAKRLGVELAGDSGPIDERWELCKIRYEDDGRDEWAARTGPVTARVISIARANRAQHYHDVVAFDAKPANKPPKKGEEKDHVWIYPFVARISEGGHRAFEIDGPHPGPEALETLEKKIRGAGIPVQVLSGDAYRVKVDDQNVPGLFAVLAVPRGVAPRDAHALLASATAVLARPLTWRALAEEAGDSVAAEEHAALAARYGL
ncbi:MAG: tetratricopeptide repeat protein [Polyangiales bacterium]